MTHHEESSLDTVMPRGLPAVAMREGSGTDSVAPEVHADSLRRLGWLALIYSLTYSTVEIYGIATHSDMPLDRHLLSLIPVSIGFLLWAAARAQKISRKAFPVVLIGFQLVSTIGIILATWGWEGFAGQALRDLAQVTTENPELFLARLKEHDIRIFSADGVPWIGVWILIVPLVLPLSPRQTVIGLAFW